MGNASGRHRGRGILLRTILQEVEKLPIESNQGSSKPSATQEELERLKAIADKSAASHGADHSEAVEAALAVAEAHRTREEYAEAKRIQLGLIILLRRRSVGDDDPRMFKTVLRYSVTLANLGELSDALDLGQQVVEAAERQYGIDSETADLARRNQAITLRQLGMYEELNDLDERSLQSRERALGADHVQTARAQFVLAHDKALLYDFNTAVQLGRKAAKSFSQAFGEHGRETMLANNNLALHLAECGMIPEASKLIGQTAKLARRVLRQDDELRDRIETNAVLIRTSFAKD